MQGIRDVYIGWDSREEVAYRVARYSLLRRSSIKLDVHPLKQDDLRQQGIYWREVDKLSSTEFTFTRFLVPYLNDFEDWALFVDCDFLFLEDINEFFELADDQYAVMCVKHNYTPDETRKMDGRVQHQYPRKNWSSCLLFNCGHPANSVLTPELVNRETGSFLHRLQWLDDELIGSLDHTWNWLEGWYVRPEHGTPKAVHFTRGGPWFEDWQDVEYGDLWRQELQSLIENSTDMPPSNSGT